MARPGVVPLSSAQGRMWFLNRLEGQNPAYNIPVAWRLSGGLDRAALRAALADVAGRHESLRTVFPDLEGVPRQQVLGGAAGCPVLAVAETSEGELAGRLAEAARGGFDVGCEPPLRAVLFVLGEQEHVLLLVVHHIAGDGWSVGVLARDLGVAYAARCGGRAPGWAPLPVQYADYALWQRGLLAGDGLAGELAFWREVLAGLPGELELPADRPRPAVPSYRGGLVPVRLDAGLHAGLLDVARRCRATLFMVVQAGLAVLLSRLGAGTDIPVGVPVAGRGDEALADLVGLFVNTLVLRADLSGDPGFTELVRRVREADLAAYAHQDLPFERLVEDLGPARSASRNPLFQVMLAFQDLPREAWRLPGLRAVPLLADVGASRVDLSFMLAERRGRDGAPAGVQGVVEYSADLFDAGTAEALAARLVRVLEQVAADPGRRVSQVDILGAAERRQVLAGWNDTARPVPAATLPELFRAQAGRTPQATAVTCGTTRLTYAQLEAEANRLAQYLVQAGVGPEQVVALAVPRSAQMVVAVLGVLQAGAAYLPIDPGYPAGRIAFMLGDAGPALCLCTAATSAALPAGHPVRKIVLDDPAVARAIASRPAACPGEP
ncbi:MAG: condensation domain-containing protein, partial [Streptosporangiaceae bacterium]